MKELTGRVAVITGAASGMDLAFAHRFADEGIHLVLADVEAEPLAEAEATLRARDVRTLSVRTDVMRSEEVSELAEAAFSTFGNVHILCNNAGVAAGTPGPGWQAPLSDWEWVLGVNFLGVLHGIRAFVPRMLTNGEEGHIVNTASVLGILTGADSYCFSKHAVVCLTEGLYREFKSAGSKLSASVLCPDAVNTRIVDAERNRPRELGAANYPANLSLEDQDNRAKIREAIKGGFPPSEIANRVLEAIQEDRFYIIPAQPDMLEAVKQRFDDLVNLRNPSL